MRKSNAERRLTDISVLESRTRNNFNNRTILANFVRNASYFAPMQQFELNSVMRKLQQHGLILPLNSVSIRSQVTARQIGI